MALTVSVVIPTRDRCESLLRMLHRVLDDRAVTEVVVVDDGSTDATAATVRGLAGTDPRLRVIRTDGHGTSRAKQAGAEAARGDVLLFLDDDVVPLPGLAEGHRRHHDTETGLVVVGYMPTVVPVGNRFADVAVRIYARDYETQVARYERGEDAVLRDLWGGNISMRRADAVRVGIQSEPAFRYHEDKDLGLRCRRAGMRGVFDRTLAAEHRPTRTFDAYLRVAHLQGHDLVRIHQTHADVLGPIDAGRIGSELPAPGRVAVALATAPVIGAFELRVLPLAVRLLAHSRLQRVQTGAAVTARAVAQRRGVQAALADPQS